MLTACPITLRAANRLVTELHRHHQPARGWKFGVGAKVDGKLVGAVLVGRPVSREFDEEAVAEVNRLVTDGTRNACSFLYSVAARLCREMGYVKIQTYILDEETGTSLRAAGWEFEATTSGGNWGSSVKFKAQGRRNDQPQGPKQRWAKWFRRDVEVMKRKSMLNSFYRTEETLACPSCGKSTQADAWGDDRQVCPLCGERFKVAVDIRNTTDYTSPMPTQPLRKYTPSRVGFTVAKVIPAKVPQLPVVPTPKPVVGTTVSTIAHAPTPALFHWTCLCGCKNQDSRNSFVLCTGCGATYGELPVVKKRSAVRVDPFSTDAPAKKSDSFPLVSVLPRHDMDRVIEIMKDDSQLADELDGITTARRAMKKELVEIAVRNDVPGGLRWGSFTAYIRGMKTKKTFSPKKAKAVMVEAGLEAELLEGCYSTSEPYADVKIEDSTKPKKEKAAGGGDDEGEDECTSAISLKKSSR